MDAAIVIFINFKIHDILSNILVFFLKFYFEYVMGLYD